ncbi:5-formyltetrahydrofolate cyclo-ligase [Geomicrobium halophilum]|uniref:5-formyltetrahydrofolate cyclo-ligase n=1 Tax=Geomicrobium halophilum TaxID=549000 RepID=A0A841PXL4_9BACL|nr:5-formyltetrahydrofolate cyclo-ligase [Geomicrobium halophilum]MBB6448872.1 5-formyltetrahydrofolate cyclo-ligase [Geomicrobium halophilum]
MRKKKEIRTYIGQHFQTMTSDEREKRGRLLHEELYSDKIWKDAGVIATTIDTYREVPTRDLIERAWAENKQVVIPKTEVKSHALMFYSLSSFSKLKQMGHGLLEPDPARCAFVPEDELDLVIVPGVAFNVAGYRIGFGGGYYDRFLGCYKGPTVSFAFSFQMFSRLPIESHDIPVQRIVAENP